MTPSLIREVHTDDRAEQSHHYHRPPARADSQARFRVPMPPFLTLPASNSARLRDLGRCFAHPPEVPLVGRSLFLSLQGRRLLHWSSPPDRSSLSLKLPRPHLGPTHQTRSDTAAATSRLSSPSLFPHPRSPRAPPPQLSRAPLARDGRTTAPLQQVLRS
eukprot:2023065-Rhodomonas_salina.3